MLNPDAKITYQIKDTLITHAQTLRQIHKAKVFFICKKD